MKKIYCLLSILLFIHIINGQISPDSYMKGKEGSLHIWISETGVDGDGVCFLAYDFDKNQERGTNQGFQGTYKTIQIGEYDYTKENLKALGRERWGTNYEWLRWNDQNISSITNTFSQEKPLSVTDFNRVYGSWFSLLPAVSSYANPNHVIFRDKENGTVVKGWGLPSIDDILQIIGQAPSSGNANTDLLNFVGASNLDVPVGHNAYWYNTYKNISGLTLTPLGSREPYVGNLATNVYAFKVLSKLRLRGGINEGTFSFYVSGSIFSPKDYHYSQVRYCRAKTDEELGYKLYIDKCKDEVLMLPLNEEVDLVELPKGLERGIALRYANRGNMKILKKWSEIEEEGKRIRSQIPSLPAMAPLKFPQTECKEENKLPPVTNERDLVFFYEGKEYPYHAVRVGEYYWMDSNLNVPVNNIPIKKEQIDRYHRVGGMFESSSITDGKTYWQLLGEKMGISNPTDMQINSILLPEFEKYYGTYYSFSRDPIAGYESTALNSGALFRRKGSMKEKIAGVLYGNDTISHWPNGKGLRSTVSYKFWDYPTAADMLQLIAMAGHATTLEARQFLSYAPNEVPVAFSGYGFNWFTTSQAAFNLWGSSVPVKPDKFDATNFNKYKLNMTPNGFRWDWVGTVRAKTEKGFSEESFVSGDFVGAGLNQALVLPIIDKQFDKNNINLESRILTNIQIGDNPVIVYNPYAFKEMMTIRWCRALTDEELGYKLYINRDMSPKKSAGKDYFLIFNEISGERSGSRDITGEELLLNDVRMGRVSPSSISIIKLGLNEAQPKGYYELPRGYIRGFYVQYILNNPSPKKTVSEIIDIAKGNTQLWINPEIPATVKILSANSSVQETSAISISPNPVVDILKVNADNVKKVEILDFSGNLVFTTSSKEMNIAHLNAGIYAIRVFTNNGEILTNKIIKK